CSAGAALGPAGPAGAAATAAPAGRERTSSNDSADVAAGLEQATNGGNQAGGDGNPPQYAPDEQGLLIIKNGTMTLQVAGIDAATASITFRIPATRWDEALAALRGMAVKVVDEHSTTEDVTTQVVDLAARIANLQATEHALQGIMDRARAIKDVLAVQEQLTEVRGEIEQMTAE